MTTRYGWSSALRLLRRLPPSTSSSRTFGSIKRLNDILPEETRYNYRWPCSARIGVQFPVHIRYLMRSTPHALTVITSRLVPNQYRDKEEPPATLTETERIEPAPTIEDNGADPPLPKMAGLLVSSFNTVTITPHVYVSFNVRLPSTTYTLMKISNGFMASGLKDALVADAFVKRHYPSEHNTEGDNPRWQGLLDSDGRLKLGKGGTWWMRCRLVSKKCVEVGDHVIVVGEVLSCGGYSGGEGIGLVFAEGGYREVRADIDLEKERIAAYEREKGFRRPPLHLSGSKDRSQTASSDSCGEHGSVIEDQIGVV